MFSGPIGAGKSHLGQAVADGLGWPCVGFSDEVKRLATSLGRTVDRETLAEIGESLVRDKPEEFCRAVLALGSWSPGQPIVVHGLRHVEILATVRGLVAPLPVKHVHVSVPVDVRAQRLRDRGEGDAAALDMHSTEVDVATALPRVADFVIDGAAPVTTNAVLVISWMRD